MKLPETISKYTKHFFNDVCKAEILFALSISCFPLFLIFSSPAVLLGIAGFFFILTLLRRGKVLILPSVIITAGIVMLALLSPSGKVLFTCANHA